MITISAWFILPLFLTFVIQVILLTHILKHIDELDLSTVIQTDLIIFALFELTLWLIFFAVMYFASIR